MSFRRRRNLRDCSSLKQHNYFVYLVTNSNRTVLYVGITNDLEIRLDQHYENRGEQNTFAGRYYCFNLVYWERHQYVEYAIEREKEIKKWRRAKKEALINELNPDWKFLNDEIRD